MSVALNAQAQPTDLNQWSRIFRLLSNASKSLALRFVEAIGMKVSILDSKVILADLALGKDGFVVGVDIEWSQGDFGVSGRLKPAASIGGRVACGPAGQLGVFAFEVWVTSDEGLLKTSRRTEAWDFQVS